MHKCTFVSINRGAAREYFRNSRRLDGRTFRFKHVSVFHCRLDFEMIKSKHKWWRRRQLNPLMKSIDPTHSIFVALIETLKNPNVIHNNTFIRSSFIEHRNKRLISKRATCKLTQCRIHFEPSNETHRKMKIIKFMGRSFDIRIHCAAAAQMRVATSISISLDYKRRTLYDIYVVRHGGHSAPNPNASWHK